MYTMQECNVSLSNTTQHVSVNDMYPIAVRRPFSPSPLFHVPFNVNPIFALVHSYLVHMSNVSPSN